MVVEVFNSSRDILEVSFFNHMCKNRLAVVLWFAVKVLYLMYHKNNRNKVQLLCDMSKEIDWNLDMNRKICFVNEMRGIQDKIK